MSSSSHITALSRVCDKERFQSLKILQHFLYRVIYRSKGSLTSLRLRGDRDALSAITSGRRYLILSHLDRVSMLRNKNNSTRLESVTLD